MDALCFTLKGDTAFFKKPDVNASVCFTYGNIHKIALLGIFGAVLGFGGYTQQYQRKDKYFSKFYEHMNKEMPKLETVTAIFPEFYERLSKLRIAICPKAEKGFIHKKIQTYNNSVGYASKEEGGNLVVREQWLEKPEWEIYVLLDCPEAEMLAEAIKAKTCVYIPYLGKNDHPADIYNAEVRDLNRLGDGQDRLYSLFPKEKGILKTETEDAFEVMISYKYEEKLPYRLDKWTNNYILKSFIYTDAVVFWKDQDVYSDNDKTIMFY